MNRTKEKILNFHFPVLQSQRMAIALNQELVGYGIQRTNAFVGDDNVVRVTAYHKNHYLELTIEFNGTITYTYEIDDEVVGYREGMSFEEAHTLIREFYDSTSI